MLHGLTSSRPFLENAMRRDILKTLQSEHDILRDLFARMNETTDRAKKERAQLLESIEGNLLPHAKWEEAVFYPAFAERADRDGLKTHAEALLEHHAVEQVVIPEVHAAEVETPKFAGRIKVFGEMIDHHAREEESKMFKIARKLFTPEELASFDEQYEEWKQSNAASLTIAVEKSKAGLKGALKSLTD
jgi:hemerythrin-like domain-containing protein